MFNKFEAHNKNVDSPTQFCLGSMSKKSILLKRNVYDFLVNYNSIDKCSILNIHKYLMVKNRIK